MLPAHDEQSDPKKKKYIGLPFLMSLAEIAKKKVNQFRFPKQTDQAMETLADYLQTRRESKAREKPSVRALRRARGKNMRSNRGKRREKRTLSC